MVQKSALAKHRINVPTIDASVGVMLSNRGLPLLRQARRFIGRLARFFFDQTQYPHEFVSDVSHLKNTAKFREVRAPTNSMGYCV